MYKHIMQDMSVKENTHLQTVTILMLKAYNDILCFESIAFMYKYTFGIN